MFCVVMADGEYMYSLGLFLDFDKDFELKVLDYSNHDIPPKCVYLR